MSEHILGISAFYHDSAAALLRNGEIVAAAQEERFTRTKHDHRFPANAVEFCLRQAGLSMADVGVVAFYEKPLVKFDRILSSYLDNMPHSFESFRRAIPTWARQKLDLPALISAGLGEEFTGSLLFTDHHEAHAASAFFPSPFEEAAILTQDAVGEWATSTVGRGSGNGVELVGELRFPHSLGMLYSAFTAYTGFKVNSGEYKLMGLAPYGDPRYAATIMDQLVDVHDDGSIRLNMEYFEYQHGVTMTSELFHELFDGPPRPAESAIGQKEMDLAASIQVVCEEAVLRSAGYVRDKTGASNLVMAGGVALNCVANGRLRREGPFDDIWVQPAAGDAGGALGAAYLAWHHFLDRPRVVDPRDAQKGSLLGPAFDDTEVGLFLDSLGAVYTKYEYEGELLDRVATLMDTGKVIGWFHGRMEYGPRALGGRSIIGDPRSEEMQRTMNLKIKFRESFRPFAPCVLREHATEVFEMEAEDESPYMLFTAPVREELRTPLSDGNLEQMSDPDLRVRVSVKRSEIPAVTHVDYSARIQTVDPGRHGRFYRLMKKFHDLTGCPVVVNTSFNIRGEPIVCTPRDAFQCFMGTHMDCLVLESHLLMKTEQPTGLRGGAEAYRASFELD